MAAELFETNKELLRQVTCLMPSASDLHKKDEYLITGVIRYSSFSFCIENFEKESVIRFRR